ncbi:DUF500-domain-containing protein [Dacryopinax primogenitus]|uniref:DUF500-domain-containing protein n=1 Tax=Dacryopinax primogenitus (strain DJM 731) TaxID=1858805 RepID=M5FZD7_DACPD|nr:DUF500-domain-containing protein [Dacryopinax primogenitus]EJU01879.1 DUF500-domain-containing protein [Dacryopinax primogenitus]
MWETTKSAGKATWNGLYKVADHVGFWTNKQVAKMGMEAFYPTQLETEVIKAARILRTFTLDASDVEEKFEDRKKTQKVIRKIPPSAIDRCAGLAIFTVFRTGFVISGAGGSGVVIAKLPDGSWSAPSGILLHTLGWGFLAGADVYDVVLILRTPAALNSFTSPRVTLGGEMAVSAGPVGNGVMLEAGKELSPVWSYTKSKGLYGGLQVDGNIMIERTDENARSYHKPGVKARDILAGDVYAPAWCAPLHQTILAASGHQTAIDQIPTGPSASEIEYSPPRRLEREPEDEDDQVARAEMEERMREFGIEDPHINVRRQSHDEFMVHEETPSSSAPQTPPTTTPGTPPTIKGSPAPPRPPRRFIAPVPSRHLSDQSSSRLSTGSQSNYPDGQSSERVPSPLIPEEEAAEDSHEHELPSYADLPATEQSNGHLDRKSGDFGIAQ